MEQRDVTTDYTRSNIVIYVEVTLECFPRLYNTTVVLNGDQKSSGRPTSVTAWNSLRSGRFLSGSLAIDGKERYVTHLEFPRTKRRNKEFHQIPKKEDHLTSDVKITSLQGYFSDEKKIELREDLKNRRGLAVSLEIICHNCEESTSTMSSKISNKCFDVNLRLTYGMRAIGKGGAAARIFCGLMNLPPPPAKFERHNSLFLNVLKTISEDSMNAAVHEAVIANDNNSNIAVAVDGTWHKRGYSSLNGVVCATSLLRTERLSILKLSQNIVLHVRVKKPCENCAKKLRRIQWGMECRGYEVYFSDLKHHEKHVIRSILVMGTQKDFLL
ncbi:uncharacterized protein TNCV_1862511 [Trichonephila clavipes]|nr:uncharacterized protein TNCV_1862511 [Trichonephila clavipes]